MHHDAFESVSSWIAKSAFAFKTSALEVAKSVCNLSKTATNARNENKTQQLPIAGTSFVSTRGKS